jgi:hypothetical protein
VRLIEKLKTFLFSPRSSPDLTGWAIQLGLIKFSTNSFFICHYFLQNTSKFFAAFADSSEKNNAAAYDFSDFFPLPAFLSLSAVFNNSPDVYKKNPAASLTFLQSSLFQNPVSPSSDFTDTEMQRNKNNTQKIEANLLRTFISNSTLSKWVT